MDETYWDSEAHKTWLRLTDRDYHHGVRTEFHDYDAIEKRIYEQKKLGQEEVTDGH